jgi:alkylated DNA nucleotide flippase Atl1
MVGAALKFLQDPSVPWQRVISSSGAISDRGDGGEGANRQAQRLREGVWEKSEVATHDIGQS